MLVTCFVAVAAIQFIFGDEPNGSKRHSKRKSVNCEASSIKASIARAYQKMMTGDFKSGVAIADKVLLIDPVNSQAYFVRAMCLEALNFNLDAISDYERGLELNDSDANFFGLLGLVYNKIGIPDKAIENLQIAVNSGHSNYKMILFGLLQMSDVVRQKVAAHNAIPEKLQRRESTTFDDDLKEVDIDLLNETIRKNLSLLRTQVIQNPDDKDLNRLYEFAKSKFENV